MPKSEKAFAIAAGHGEKNTSSIETQTYKSSLELRRDSDFESDLIGIIKPVVVYEYSKLGRNAKRAVDFGDFLNVGCLAYLEAKKNFKPDKSAEFKTYASHIIKGRIKDYLRLIDPLSRDQRRKERLKSYLEDRPHDYPKFLAKTAKILKKDSDTLHREVITEPKITFRSMNFSDPDRTGEVISLPDPASLNTHTLKENRILIQNALKYAQDILSGQNKGKYIEAHRLYYEEGLTMKEVGNRLGVNESRAAQYLAAVRKLMKEYFDQQGLKLRNFKF